MKLAPFSSLEVKQGDRKDNHIDINAYPLPYPDMLPWNLAGLINKLMCQAGAIVSSTRIKWERKET